jgi:hypothetical protein
MVCDRREQEIEVRIGTFRPVTDFRSCFEWFDEPPPRSAEGRREIRHQLVILWQAVREEIGQAKFDETLGSVRAGDRSTREENEHVWAQTHAEKDESTPNLTIEIYAQELCLNLVGFFDGQFDKVRNWIVTRQGRRFLRAHPELVLVVFVRTAREGKGGKMMWKGAASKELERIELSSESPAAIAMRLSTLARQIEPGRQRLALHVRRGWDRETATGMNGVSEIAEMVEAWMTQIQAIQVGDEPRSW